MQFYPHHRTEPEPEQPRPPAPSNLSLQPHPTASIPYAPTLAAAHAAARPLYHQKNAVRRCPRPYNTHRRQGVVARPQIFTLTMSTSILRIAARGGPSTFFRANTIIRPAAAQPLTARAAVLVPALMAGSSFSTSARLQSEHQEESFEEFSAR